MQSILKTRAIRQAASRISSLNSHLLHHNLYYAASRSMASSTNTKPWAVVAGVGPGTGASVARKFGREYPIALLARSAEHLEPYVKEINDAGGKAIGISTDVSDAGSVKAAFAKIEAEFGSGGAAAAVFNAGGGFIRKGLLDLSEEEFTLGYQVGV